MLRLVNFFVEKNRNWDGGGSLLLAVVDAVVVVVVAVVIIDAITYHHCCCQDCLLNRCYQDSRATLVFITRRFPNTPYLKSNTALLVSIPLQTPRPACVILFSATFFPDFIFHCVSAAFHSSSLNNREYSIKHKYKHK